MTEANDDASDDATGDALDFEAALGELEALVERMESGELTLDASLGAFERGIHLTRACRAPRGGGTARARPPRARGRESRAHHASDTLDGD